MLDSVRQQPCDSPATESLLNIDRLAHRRLDQLLIGTDLLLQQWGRQDLSTPWPESVVAVEAAVRRLYWQLVAALMATYCTVDLPLAKRIFVYDQLLVDHLANLSPAAAAKQRPARGENGFKRNLDRARWSVRSLLKDPDPPDEVRPPAPEPKPFGFYSTAAQRARRDLGQR